MHRIEFSTLSYVEVSKKVKATEVTLFALLPKKCTIR